MPEFKRTTSVTETDIVKEAPVPGVDLGMASRLKLSNAAVRFADTARSNVTDAMRVLGRRDPAGVVELARKWGVDLSEQDAAMLVESYAQMPPDQLRRLESVFENKAFT